VSGAGETVTVPPASAADASSFAGAQAGAVLASALEGMAPRAAVARRATVAVARRARAGIGKRERIRRPDAMGAGTSRHQPLILRV
jgi:hypothetical protein